MMHAVLLGLLALSPTAAGGYDLRLQEVEGEILCSIQARNTSIEAVLRDIAERTARPLSGFEGRGVIESVSLDLAERPLNHVIATLAGCAGLRARITSSAIEVYPDVGERASPEEIDDQAEVACLRALKSFPEDEGAARADFLLGEIQERRGHDSAALSHFEAAARSQAGVELVAEALLRAGFLLERMGDWREATRPFTALANLVEPHPYQAKARLEIARCMTYSGDARQALFMLDALDEVFPTRIDAERQARLYVRARAYNGAGQHAQALRALAEADALGQDLTLTADVMEMRAEALEHFDQPAEAARAWLAFAEKSVGADRARALVNAARLAASASDWIAVLMIDKHARASGIDTQIAPFARAARQSLGLGDDLGLRSSPEDDLLRAEEHVSARLYRQARELCEPLYRNREALSEPLFARLVLVYARALDAEQGVAAAIEVLRTSVRSMSELEHRRAVYLLAGELYESHELFDEAIAAYEGVL